VCGRGRWRIRGRTDGVRTEGWFEGPAGCVALSPRRKTGLGVSSLCDGDERFQHRWTVWHGMGVYGDRGRWVETRRRSSGEFMQGGARPGLHAIKVEDVLMRTDDAGRCCVTACGEVRLCASTSPMMQEERCRGLRDVVEWSYAASCDGDGGMKLISGCRVGGAGG